MSVYYMVCSAPDLLKVVEHFDLYPVRGVKKRKAFEIWKEMVFAKTVRPVDRSKIIGLAKQLSAMNMKPRGAFAPVVTSKRRSA